MRVNQTNQRKGKKTEYQMRLRLRTGVGVLDMMFAGRDSVTGLMRWAWPGGGSRTYGEIVRLCRHCGWPRPELLPTRVVYRAETEEESDGQ